MNRIRCVFNLALAQQYTEEEYTKLKRKIDKYLLPLMWLCYGIQQTDKISISTQATFGLRDVREASLPVA